MQFILAIILSMKTRKINQRNGIGNLLRWTGESKADLVALGQMIVVSSSLHGCKASLLSRYTRWHWPALLIDLLVALPVDEETCRKRVAIKGDLFSTSAIVLVWRIFTKYYQKKGGQAHTLESKLVLEICPERDSAQLAVKGDGVKF